MVDALGFPLCFILTYGERHDLTKAGTLITSFHFDTVTAGKSCDSAPLRAMLQAKQVEVSSHLAAIAGNKGTRTPTPSQIRRAFQQQKQAVSAHFHSVGKASATFHGFLAFCRYPELALTKRQRILRSSPTTTISLLPTLSLCSSDQRSMRYRVARGGWECGSTDLG